MGSSKTLPVYYYCFKLGLGVLSCRFIKLITMIIIKLKITTKNLNY